MLRASLVLCCAAFGPSRAASAGAKFISRAAVASHVEHRVEADVVHAARVVKAAEATRREKTETVSVC